MADQYATLGSDTTIKVLSQTEAIDAEAIRIRTKPSDVRLTVVVPLTDFQAGTYESYLATTADLVEGLLAVRQDGQQSYDAAVQSQDTDASNLLSYYLSIRATYNPAGSVAGPFHEWVTFPMTRFETAAAFDAAPSPIVTLNAAYDRLKQLAGL